MFDKLPLIEKEKLINISEDSGWGTTPEPLKCTFRAEQKLQDGGKLKRFEREKRRDSHQHLSWCKMESSLFLSLWHFSSGLRDTALLSAAF